MQPLLISVNEFATMVGIGRTKVYELIGQNAIHTKMIGRRRLISLESAQKFASQYCAESDAACGCGENKECPKK